MQVKTVNITSSIDIGNTKSPLLIAGPCVMEPDINMLYQVGLEIKKICYELNIPYVFKTSYDKANRSSINSYRGPGLKKALPILRELKKELDVPLLLDIHSPKEADLVADIADIIQIPAFLCRQTDLIIAASQTKKVINIKKGQFLSPEDMKNIVEKIEKYDNNKILLTERGVSFGYHNLIVDMRSFRIMQQTGYPVIIDATHSVQLPGTLNGSTGGKREFVPIIAKASIAAGANGIFMEVHPEPPKALCDAQNQFYLKDLKPLLKDILNIYRVVNKNVKAC